MPEYPYQTWQRLFGRSWPNFAELQDLYNKRGITAAPGSYEGNIALQQAVLGGWNPYAPAPAPSPAAAPAPAPAPTPPPTPSVPMQIEPGAYLELQNTILELQRQEAAAQDARDKERIANERRGLEAQALEMELRLASSPIDYVAYELYKRARQAEHEVSAAAPLSEGYVIPGPTAAPTSDVDIQAMIAALAGEGGGSLGVGEFGVDIPATQAISRAESLTYSPDEMDILGSFLKAGFDVNGKEVSYDPVDYWREVEEGFIPTIQAPASTRYSF